MTKFKPYDLVYVIVRGQHTEDGKRTYIGEAMSFPTPAGTLMVRRVPGHPGTLEEVSLNDVQRLAGPRHRYVHYARLSGVGKFPTDMLRYASCAPVNFQLVVDRHGTPAAAELLPDMGTELLVAKTSTGAHNVHWCQERWASFLWRLEPVKTERIEEAS